MYGFVCFLVTHNCKQDDHHGAQPADAACQPAATGIVSMGDHLQPLKDNVITNREAVSHHCYCPLFVGLARLSGRTYGRRPIAGVEGEGEGDV